MKPPPKHSAAMNIGLARPDALDPAPEHGGRQAEKGDGDGEDPAHSRQIPIAGRRMGDADELGERQVEGRERVGLADRQMHGKAAGGTRKRS